MIEIKKDLLDKIAGMELPNNLGFGQVMAPILINSTYNKHWSKLEVLPYESFCLGPSSKVLHYAQEIFEGLKAYRTQGGGVQLFRPEENAKRFNCSAFRMAMPDFPIEMFLDAVETIAHYCEPIIPHESGSSLYIRPVMFGTDTYLGVKPSQSYLCSVMASPSGSYFSSGKVNVLIEREMCRATPGGTGNIKAGANYALSLFSAQLCAQKGFQQTLWLDAINKRCIEELSGMNFMAVINGEIFTPKLTGTILPGITRDSIVKLAPTLGFKIHEESMEINELIEKVKSGECTEAFACGTAAVVTVINALGEVDGTKYQLKDQQGRVGNILRKNLLDMQEGRRDDPFGWIVKV